ncbi:transcription initiation factor TFIID subunit 1-like [Tasmannia lanceolata]|uniref:transcription initiation factor TFIID subunit 1-like n=1 Tax=Tasmannia lanceolata TaxID=3420 RepID=UPI004063084F
MRTNKNCPKFPLGVPIENTVPENQSGKSHIHDASTQPQQKTPAKKLLTKGVAKSAAVEMPESTENLGSKLPSKILPLKLKCGPSDKLSEKNVAGTQGSDKQVAGDPEAGNIANIAIGKINKLKISSKMKSEDLQIESQKPLVVIRPPVEADRDPPRKNIIIKQPKEIINVEQIKNALGPGIEDGFRRPEKMVDLSSFIPRRKGLKYLAEQEAQRKTYEERRLWEVEEKRRSKERMRDERAWREERQMREEQQIELDLGRHESRVQEERQKANKKKKKGRKLKDEYLEEHRENRKDRRIPERDRAAKRRPVFDLGNYATEYAPPTKRRRAGEVALSNILGNIVEGLRDTKEISYLFLKPVSKKEAPDYLDFITTPMDLSTIREKVRRQNYKSREDFRHDVWQITYNAHYYNDSRNPSIPPLGDQLLELCDYLLKEHDAGLTEAESGIKLKDT